MLYPDLSAYPGKADELLFFQDIDLEQLPVMLAYQKLLGQKQYTQANEYIGRQTGIHGYFAGLFNLLETRIYTLQKHILTKQKHNPMFFSADEPQGIKKNESWISN